MSINFIFDIIISAISIIGNLLITLLVIFQKNKKRINFVFTLFSLSLTGWLITLFLFYNPFEMSWLLLIGRLNFAFMIITVYFLYHFVDLFPEKIFKPRNWLNLILTIETAFLFLITIFTPWIDQNEIAAASYRETVWGKFYFLFIIHFLLYIAVSITILILKYKKFTKGKKQQIRYIIWAISSSAFLGFITNIVAPYLGFHNISKIGPLSILFLTSLIAYTIIRHRFLDIRVVIRQGTIYILSILTTLILAFYLVVGINYFAKVSLNQYLLAIGLLFSLIVFEPTKKIFQKFANKYLFTSLYNYQQTIEDLSQELTRTIELAKVVDYLTKITQDTMKLEKFSIVLKNKKGSDQAYREEKSIGFENKKQTFISIVKPIISYIENNQNIILFDELSSADEEINKIKDLLEKEKIAICLPLLSKEQVIGIIFLGQKISNDAYSKQDLGLLEVLANQTAISIKNALLYSEVQDFTQNLQKKVEEQTRDIQDLFAVKNKFLHLVSHQLRTPLTALKGLIELWNDSDYASLETEEKDKIKEKITISCDRLAETTNTMLDTLNLDAGRIRFNIQPIDLESKIEEVLEMFKINFAKKDLELKFIKPTPPFPLIEVDPRYFPQVIQNLTDNALKYTQKGGLTISLKAISKSKIQIIFEDTGIGLTPEEKKMIFKEKFFRGQDAIRQYTSGTGLGLYLVQKIIEGHHGKIEIFSLGRNQGTKFIITLSIKQI